MKPEYLRVKLWLGQLLLTVIAVLFEDGKVFLPSLIIGAFLNYVIFLILIELSIWIIWRRERTNPKMRNIWSFSFGATVFALYSVAHKAVDVIPLRYHKPDPVNFTELAIALVAGVLYYLVLSGRVPRINKK